MAPARARLARWGGLLLLVLALVAAAWLALKPPAAQARGPIVIGLVQALSGPAARSELPLVAAARLAVEEINAAGGLLGRRVELRIEDSRGDPRVAAAAAERLITTDKAVALFGCGGSACREAVKAVVEVHRHLLFYPAADEGMETSAHIIYTGPTPNQQALPATDWALQRFGRRVYLVGSDAASARRLGAVLRNFIGLQGGQLVGERYVAAAGREPEAVAAELERLRPDVVLNLVGGEGNRALFDALVNHGLADLPLLSLRGAEPEMKACDGGRLDRHFTAWGYLQSQPGAANQAFLASLRRSQGEQAEASDAAAASYVGVGLWAAAVREGGSERTDVVNANVVHQAVAGPQGFAAIDSQSRHLWRQLRVAQVRPGGQLAEVALLPRYIRPQPWPAFRTTSYWAALMSQAGSAP